jgi:hypothetical protein
MKRTRDDLRETLTVQTQMLRTSCTLYDMGQRWEGARIATVVCTLVHDGGRNFKSIITQLGARKTFICPTSAFFITPEQLTKIHMFTPLIRLHRYKDGRRSEFHPLCLSGKLDGAKILSVRLASMEE